MYTVPAIFLLFRADDPVQNFPFSELFSMMGRTSETRNRKCHDELKTKLEDNLLYKRYKQKLTSTPVSSAFQFRKLVKMTKPALKNLRIPVLIVQGECDAIVPVSSAYYLYETIPSEEKELCLLPESKHHVCLEENSSILFQTVEEFLKSCGIQATQR